MTAEVAILNKMGLAIAADSALTMSNNKVHHGAQKIFGADRPYLLGVMIFGNSELMGVPCGLFIREFLSSLEGPLPTLSDYGDALIAFLVESSLFSEELQRAYVYENASQ